MKKSISQHPMTGKTCRVFTVYHSGVFPGTMPSLVPEEDGQRMVVELGRFGKPSRSRRIAVRNADPGEPLLAARIETTRYGNIRLVGASVEAVDTPVGAVFTRIEAGSNHRFFLHGDRVGWRCSHTVSRRSRPEEGVWQRLSDDRGWRCAAQGDDPMGVQACPHGHEVVEGLHAPYPFTPFAEGLIAGRIALAQAESRSVVFGRQTACFVQPGQIWAIRESINRPRTANHKQTWTYYLYDESGLQAASWADRLAEGRW